MKTNGKCRLELVSPRQIKRMPGIHYKASPKEVGKARNISKGRGYYRPVTLSDSQGCMTLIAGAATYEACIADKATNIPAVIVQTEGEADELMFALESAELYVPPNAVAVGSAIVQLIDAHRVTRRHISEALGKSPAWVNRMESLSRKLVVSVQKMVAEGQMPQRSAQEIARLPDDVQAQFAVSVACEFLSKENVTYLVNRYLNEDTSIQERDRIIRTPKLALPNERMKRGRMGRDYSDSARLACAIARCMDDASYLSGLLDRIDIQDVSVRMADVTALSDSLTSLVLRFGPFFTRVKNGGIADD